MIEASLEVGTNQLTKAVRMEGTNRDFIYSMRSQLCEAARNGV